MTPESESICLFLTVTLGKLRCLGLGYFTYEMWEIAYGLQHCYEGHEGVFKTPCSVWALENILLQKPGIC